MIRQAMTDWKHVTEELLQAAQKDDEKSREETIETIENLLEQRDKLAGEITAPFTTEEERLGKVFVQVEKEVQKKLAHFSKRIRQDILQAQSKKTHMKEYLNPYGKMGGDGAYYDTKH